MDDVSFSGIWVAALMAIRCVSMDDGIGLVMTGVFMGVDILDSEEDSLEPRSTDTNVEN